MCGCAEFAIPSMSGSAEALFAATFFVLPIINEEIKRGSDTLAWALGFLLGAAMSIHFSTVAAQRNQAPSLTPY